MANCAELDQQTQQLADKLASLTQEGVRYANLNPTSADIALEAGRVAARLLGQINTTKSELLRLQDIQRNSACPFTGFLPQRRAADAAVSNLNAFIDKMEQIAQTAKKQEEATQKATTTQNNAGTGKPNTAGTGATATPDADQLKEVEVTAKRKPESLDEVQVTGVRKDTTGLDEVQVTGKRNPDGLEEVQVTGKRNPDELQEVQVTGKKNTNTGVAPQIKKAQAQASLQDATNFGEAKDWRVRLALSPGANYLYKAADPGILKPLNDSNGVIFPYTPTINVNYAANYQQTSVVHSNYKIAQYENSSVDGITISCDFTAQDTFEANYLLATIHFFRAATKMFYGQDENPKPGTPPPLVFLFGMGQFQFNAHPLVITSFSYNLPADVDYIRAGVAGAASGPNAALAQSPQKSLTLGGIIQNKIQNKISSGIAKLGNRIGLNLTVGGGLGAPTFGQSFNPLNPVSVSEPTYVPTKINLSISCMPMISRNNVSNNFSFKDYANGKLLQGVRNPSGGFW